MSLTGIVGGSAVYGIEDFHMEKHLKVKTPYGEPSHEAILGELEGEKCVFIPRHGEKHTLLPSEVNYKANIYAFKFLGVDRIISLSAVGSLKENIRPMDIVLPDQYLDRTNMARESTFFGGGLVAHVSFDEPVCPALREHIYENSSDISAKVHPEGTYINIEGPEFSTKAESFLYKSWGGDIIGMTNMTEARLAREAGICYSTVAMITDYDSWRVFESSGKVTADMVMQNLLKCIDSGTALLKNVLRNMPDKFDCDCSRSLENAVVTNKKDIPEEVLRRLGPIIDGRI